MHHSYDDLLAAASPPNEHGTRYVSIELQPGDTAWAPGTTKYHLLGHGKGGSVRYTFYREGAEGHISGQVARSLITS
jgi:hypothetical protein